MIPYCITYFKKLFLKDKLVFWGAFVFILTQGVLTIRVHESFPFVLYGMYSKPFHQESEILYRVKTGGILLNSFSIKHATNEMIITPFENGYLNYESGRWTQKKWTSFLLWWSVMVKKTCGVNESITVERCIVVYDIKGVPNIQKSETIYED